MRHALTALVIASLTVAFLSADADRKKGCSLNDVTLELHALHLMHQLQLTRPQLEMVQRLAKETTERGGARKAVKASEEYLKLAEELRAALLDGADEDKIDDLAEKLLDLRDKEKLDIDDSIDITDEARKHAPGFLKKLSPRQLTLFAVGISDILHDPNDILIDAIAKVRELDDKEWRQTRDQVSDQVAHLLGGLDDSKIDAMADKVTQLLIVVRSLEDDEFQKRRPDMEKRARDLVGDVGPTDILKNVVERSLAELLSNPQLPTAVAAKLDHMDKAAAKK